MQLTAAALIWDGLLRAASAFQVIVATRTALRAALPQAKTMLVWICARSAQRDIVHLDVNHLRLYTGSTTKETAHETDPGWLAAYFLVPVL